MTWSLLIRSSLSSLPPRTLGEFGTQVQEVRGGEMVNSELFQYVFPWFSGRALLCPWAEIGEGRPGPGTCGRAVEWHDLIARQWGHCQCEVHQYLQSGCISQKMACCCPWNYVSRGCKMIQFRSTDISWAHALCQTWGMWSWITHGTCLQGAYNLIGKDMKGMKAIFSAFSAWSRYVHHAVQIQRKGDFFPYWRIFRVGEELD